MAAPFRSALDVTVSCFANYRNPTDPRPVSLLQWLRSDKYAAQVVRIRQTRSRRRRSWLKAQLPAITPSGTFSRRHNAGLICHSGFVQIDIDAQDNVHLTAFEQLGQRLRLRPYIAYLGRSASGRGWWGLVRIAHPEHHRAQVRALIADFRAEGIMLDEKPVNVAALRGYSYDPAAYFNHQPVPYTGILEWPSHPPAQPPPIDRQAEARRVEHYLRQIEAHELDLTGAYDDWFALACVLANTFGEAGRAYFHRLSRFHPAYQPRQTDYHFDSAARGHYNYSLGTLYFLCEQAGLPRYTPPRIRIRWQRTRTVLQRRRSGQLEIPFK